MIGQALSTGIQKFDDFLGGGIPETTSVLLLGPPKSGKTLLSSKFLFEGLKNNEYGICIITNQFPEKFVEKLSGFGDLDPILQNGLLRFVDCYSVHVGIEKGNTMFVIRVNGPTALSEISIAFSEILKNVKRGNKVRVVLDNVSTLLLYNSPNLVAEFVQVINGKAKSAGANPLFIVDEGSHDEKQIATLSSILDVIIHFKEEGTQNYIEIKGLGNRSKKIYYWIKDGKFEFRQEM